MQPVIELDDLTVHFGGREILKNLRIALSGRIIGLLGPNGAGMVIENNGTRDFYGNLLKAGDVSYGVFEQPGAGAGHGKR